MVSEDLAHKQICLNIQLTYSLLIFTWDKSEREFMTRGQDLMSKHSVIYDWTFPKLFSNFYVFWQRLFNFFLYNQNWISSSDLVMLWFFRANPVSRRAVCLTLINHDWIFDSSSFIRLVTFSPNQINFIAFQNLQVIYHYK